MRINVYIYITSLVLLSCQGSTNKNINKVDTNRVSELVAKDLVPDYINQDYVMGRFEPDQHPAFVRIDKKYTTKEEIYLNKETYTAFIKMYDAAQADQISLIIRSAARNFDYQRGIWERKWTGETKLSGDIDASIQFLDPIDRAKSILLYSSMPGTSRHHWGTDIDLNAFENSYFEHGQGLKEYRWLQNNAGRFGFCQTYTAKDDTRPTGYEEEKWHWSYIPVAKEVLKWAKDQLSNQDITGFKGAETARKLNIMDNYVLGINPNCT